MTMTTVITKWMCVLVFLSGVGGMRSNVRAQDPLGPPGDAGDAALLAAIDTEIASHPGTKKAGLLVSVKDLNNGYATLEVQRGRPDLAHWLQRGREVVQGVLRNPQTGDAFKQQAEVALRLADAIEQRHGVQVYWEELPEQRKRCPECPKKQRRADLWRFEYPNLSVADFQELLDGYRIAVAAPVSLPDMPGYHVVASDSGHRTFHQFERGDEEFWLPIRPNELGYHQTQELLRLQGLKADARGVLYHVFSKELYESLIERELELIGKHGRQPREITWVFRKAQPNSRTPWLLYAKLVVPR